jgi:hypothetical protein
MDQQNDWVDQQYMANEAVKVLEGLNEYLTVAQYEGGLSLHGMATIQASLTMLREVILNAYGLSKEDLLITDYDDFVEFVVSEANE